MTWWGLYLIGWGLFGAADFALAPGRYVFGFTVGSTSGASAAETVARLIEEPDDPFAAPLKLVALAVLGSSALAALLLVRRLSLRQLAAAEALGVVVTSRTGEVGTATGATSRRWPWVAVPVAVAVALAGLLVLVPSGRRGDGGDGDGGDGDEVSVGGERFLDPEGYYEIELHPDWEPLQGTATGTEAFAVGSPRAGFQPNVVLVTSEDAQELDEAAYLERVMDQITSTPGFDVLDSGMVSAPSGNDLAYLEWTIDATGAETIHGYTVIDVSHGYSATADMAGPSSTFDELFAEAEPFLLTLRLAA